MANKSSVEWLVVEAALQTVSTLNRIAGVERKLVLTEAEFRYIPEEVRGYWKSLILVGEQGLDYFIGRVGSRVMLCRTSSGVVVEPCSENQFIETCNTICNAVYVATL